jgi:hypothetical protein
VTTYYDAVFRRGFDAYQNDELSYGNPYDKGTPEYDYWLQGWRTADLYDMLDEAYETIDEE